MNSKYIFTFVMTLVIGSAFILFINSGFDVETIEEEITTTTTIPATTTTTIPATTTTTIPATTTTTIPATTTTTIPATTTTTIPATTTTTIPATTTTTIPATTTTTIPATTTTTIPATTTTTIQSTDTLGDEESVQIVDDYEETPIAYDGEFLNFVGFEGNNQDKLDQLVLSMPQVLKDVLKDKVIYVNGCHEYARSLVGRCPYGVWDSSGTNSDGSKGAEWSMSIWISNRAFDAQQAEDVLIHESSHALSYLTRNCNTTDNQSYRLDAWASFGGEEKFADALVLYFGGSYNHYRDSGELSNEETSYLKDYFEACTNF